MSSMQKKALLPLGILLGSAATGATPAPSVAIAAALIETRGEA